MTTKRLLIVSPHFPPSNTADCHRARMLIPFLGNLGWEAEVLAVDPDSVAAPLDPWLVEGLPVDVPIHRAKAIPLTWSRIPGLGTLDFRAFQALKKRGCELLQSRNFDLVLFSTTVFGAHTLGIYFRNKFGVPFIMDYQDLWTTDFYTKNKIKPPGGWIKYSLSQAFGKLQQGRVLNSCSGLIAVNAKYLSILEQEYPTIADLPKISLPFPASTLDAERIRHGAISQSEFSIDSETVNWVYVGVCGPLMERSLTAFFTAVERILIQSPIIAKTLRINFIGTSYAPLGSGILSVKPIAQRIGKVGEIVREATDRVPFSTALKCLEDADALIIPGTDDPSYTASKLYQYLLAQKCVLAIFRQESTVCDVLRNVGGGHIVGFSESDSNSAISESIYQYLTTEPPFLKPHSVTNMDLLRPVLDRTAAKTLSDFLHLTIAQPNITSK